MLLYENLETKGLLSNFWRAWDMGNGAARGLGIGQRNGPKGLQGQGVPIPVGG